MMKSSLLAIVALGVLCVLAREAFAQDAKDSAASGPKGSVQEAKPSPLPVPNLPVLTRTELEGQLIVEDLKIGDGALVKEGGAVVAHYEGALRSAPGTVFDSSFERGEPLGLQLTHVIPGWRKGIPGMRVGSVRRLTVPAAMAYGENSPNPGIPANSDLVFVVQIVDTLQFEDLKAGEGEATTGKFVAVTAHTITDASGKILERRDASDPYIWVEGESQFISAGLEGMKRGGKRRITVPALLNQPNSRFPSTLPHSVSVTIELELLNLKNIPDSPKPNKC